METASHSARRGTVLLALLLSLAAAAVPAEGRADAATHTLADPNRSYEVLLPASPGKGQPLIVFLHGSGKPDLERFKADYGPLLAKRGCLTALPKADSKLKWRYDDARYIMSVIADVEKRYQTDPNGVLLMGVSGGGQTALFLADHTPERFRAVIVISTNPVVVRGQHHEWFYPSKATAKTCPYFVVNHITQGAALQYWRQVRARREGDGTSISILPVLGPVSHYLPPPKELAGWLDEVLAGRHPAPIPDPQKAAVAKMLAEATAALPKAIAAAKPAATTQQVTKDGEVFRLIVPAPPDFERSEKEDKADSADRPVTQVRVEHKKWPVYLRCDARRTDQPMANVLAAEEKQTILRGMLYQVYHAGSLDAGGRTWQIKVGSITYPDRTRGWVSALFIHAAAAMKGDPRQWLEVTVVDETQQPDAGELAGILKTTLAGIAAGPAPPAAPKPAPPS
ncbi:MAG: alpha/beta hydrolase [Phycisphaerae bacterium]